MMDRLLLLGLLAILKVGPELHLTETRRISLPEGVQLSHAILTPGNEALVVDNRRHAVWISADSEWESIGLPFGFTPVGVNVGEMRIELIDAAGAVALIDLGASIMSSWVLDPPPATVVVDEIGTAVKTGDGWVGVGPCRRRPLESCVFNQSDRGSQRFVGEFPTPLTDDNGADRIWLSVLRDSGTLAQASQPFFRWEINLNTGAITRLESEVESPEANPCPSADWVGLRVLQVGPGTIQSYVDLASDARCIVRFDESGRIQKVTLLQNPLSLIDSSPEDQVLLGVQRLNQIELVFYRWQLIFDNSSSIIHAGGRGFR